MDFNFFHLILLFCYGVVTASPVDSDPAIIEDVQSSSPSRIVAGWPAQPGQIPHQVSIRMVTVEGGVSNCGGSVIHHHWIMTAAHCISNRYTYVIRIGLVNLTAPEMLVESGRKYIHPGYNEMSGGVQTDDIALVGVDEYIPYGQFIKPCRLMSSEQKNVDFTGVVMTASGYGRTDDLWNGGATSEILNWVHLRGISNAQCRAWYPNSRVIDEPTICAEFYNDTAQSSCQGDSGGPLTFIDFDGNPTMIGVASFVSSAGCNSPFPSGWVRPGHYHDWYRQITGINFDWTRQGAASAHVAGTQLQSDIDIDEYGNGIEENDSWTLQKANI